MSTSLRRFALSMSVALPVVCLFLVPGPLAGALIVSAVLAVSALVMSSVAPRPQLIPIRVDRRIR